MPRLIPTSCTDMVLDTMVDSDTTDMDLDTMAMDSDTTARESADAEADPYLLYGGHLGYRLGGYYGHGLGYGYGLGYRVYGKRSADAEAKPDPYYTYGLGYGLGYAGHLGYAGLGHPGYGYYYGK